MELEIIPFIIGLIVHYLKRITKLPLSFMRAQILKSILDKLHKFGIKPTSNDRKKQVE